MDCFEMYSMYKSWRTWESYVTCLRLSKSAGTTLFDNKTRLTQAPKSHYSHREDKENMLTFLNIPIKKFFKYSQYLIHILSHCSHLFGAITVYNISKSKLNPLMVNPAWIRQKMYISQHIFNLQGICLINGT